MSLVDRLGRNPNDSAAWREFVRYYGSTIRRWCHHWGLQQANADDVSQDLLMDVARQMQTFVYDPGRSFRAWLKTLAHGAWCDWLERRGRHVRGDADSQVLHRLQTVVARDDLVQRLEQKHDGRPFFSLECVEGGSLDHAGRHAAGGSAGGRAYGDAARGPSSTPTSRASCIAI